MAVIGLPVLKPSAEGRDAVIKALRDAVPKFHAEAGCELYALHESGDEIVILKNSLMWNLWICTPTANRSRQCAER
jgi:quinol monooxygenase YgiN